jgi:hypothetical protein
MAQVKWAGVRGQGAAAGCGGAEVPGVGAGWDVPGDPGELAADEASRLHAASAPAASMAPAAAAAPVSARLPRPGARPDVTAAQHTESAPAGQAESRSGPAR